MRLIVSPARLLEQPGHDDVGGFGTLLALAHDWDDEERWRRSYELLAREVVPALPSP